MFLKYGANGSRLEPVLDRHLRNDGHFKLSHLLECLFLVFMDVTQPASDKY